MSQLKLLLNWRLHAFVVVASVLSEWIGIQKFQVGPGVLLLLPLFYAFIIGLIGNPHVVKKASKWMSSKEASVGSQLLLVGILPFIAKFGTLIGPSMDKLLNAGHAMIFQELGNVFTLFIAMPFAVLVCKMGRESIGATYSIAREPNIALISEKYGLKGPEGVGVLSVYVIGTMFGSIFFALLAGYVASLEIFDIRAIAMGCGVGSGSMTAACSGSLATLYPEQAEDILAFAGASNLLTYATGLYVSAFIALPAAEWMYKKLSDKQAKKSNLTSDKLQ
ncbi:DUF3100 domain-containing protein [Vibrio sp.]|nr:DUF3100 domain-containing protein [Vibrio sp.]